MWFEKNDYVARKTKWIYNIIAKPSSISLYILLTRIFANLIKYCRKHTP